MQVLIDTHVLIWFLEGNSSLSQSRREILVDSSNDILISIASLWEIAIKISIGKLVLTDSLAEVVKQLDAESIQILTILPEHILEVSALPFHHRDPFDRIIISQAKFDNLEVMTDDSIFSAYGIQIV